MPVLPAQIDEDSSGTVICVTQIEDDGTQTVTVPGKPAVTHPATPDTIAMVADAQVADTLKRDETRTRELADQKDLTSDEQLELLRLVARRELGD